MIDALLEVAVDLTDSLPTSARYQRLIAGLRRVVPCDAAALMRLQDEVFVPLATEGLAPDTLGRRFDPADHPRLAAAIAAGQPVRFAADDPRPDPYDGLIAGVADGYARVHACMACPLYAGGELIGLLTVDALEPGVFDNIDMRAFHTFAALAAATVRTASLIEALESTASRRGQVAQQLVTEALESRGGELVGETPCMRRLCREVETVAASDLPTLIIGETGVGKELVARTLHARSTRREQPLVDVNCAALPETVAESELFGHVRGAFTGAVAHRTGKFELADGATLFLDEIGELPLVIQPKFLRALQAGEVQRVGADHNVRVDVRIVAATNRNLLMEIGTGRFRADLYHRLSVCVLQVPPLRARRADIPLLTGTLLDRAQTRLGLSAIHVTDAAHQALRRYDWPGNVRELEHLLLRAAIRASGGHQNRPVLIDEPHLDIVAHAESPVEPESEPELEPELPLTEAVDRYQRQLIERAVRATGGNWSEAARRLKVDRSNLYRLTRRLGMRARAPERDP